MRCDHIGCRTGDRDVDGCDTRDIDGGRDLGVFEGHNCDCGFGLKCLAAWKEDMQHSNAKRTLQGDHEFFAVYGVEKWAKEKREEHMKLLNTPKVGLIGENDFYMNYVTKLCCTLERIESEQASVKLSSFLPAAKDPTQLDLATVLDEYAYEQNPSSGLLLSKLRNVAYEMQKYGDGTGSNICCTNEKVVSRCQAFMLQYKDVQQSHRHDSLSYMNPQHKKYDRLRDRILYLKYEADGIEMSDQFGVAPIPPADGEGDDGYVDMIAHAPYCECHKCVQNLGYKTLRYENSSKTVTAWTAVKQKANAIRSSASISSNDGDNNDGEDWFHHTDLGTSYTSTDSRTSDIQLNTAYHKLLRDIRDRQQHGRAENRSDTAAVEQRLLVPPHVQHTHTRRYSQKGFSNFDERFVVSGVMPTRFDKRKRRHFDKSGPKSIPAVDDWRFSEKVLVDAQPVQDV